MVVVVRWSSVKELFGFLGNLVFRRDDEPCRIGRTNTSALATGKQKRKRRQSKIRAEQSRAEQK